MEDAYVAIILAGGAARRLGGGLKPARTVGGTPLLTRVLGATAGARRLVVVGPPELAPLVPAGAVLTREEPPGGGPVAALAAGLAAVRGDGWQAGPGQGSVVGTGLVGVFAADLAFLTPSVVAELCAALTLPRPAVDGAVSRPAGPGAPAAVTQPDVALLVDDAGRAQHLCAVWREDALVRAFRQLGEVANRPMRTLVALARTVEVGHGTGGGPPAWYDCDTEDDLNRAEEWLA